MRRGVAMETILHSAALALVDIPLLRLDKKLPHPTAAA